MGKSQILNKHDFMLQVVLSGEVLNLQHRTNQGDLLVLAKQVCQTIMFGPDPSVRNCEVLVSAGSQQWRWVVGNGNVLVGQNGTRDILIWKSFDQTKAVGL